MNYAPDAAAAIGAMVLLLIWCGRLMWQNRRARHNEQQLLDHVRMRAGMREAQRRGWLPEDIQ